VRTSFYKPGIKSWFREMPNHPTRKLKALCWFTGFVCAILAISPKARAQQQNTGTQSQQNQTEAPIPAYHSPYVAPAAEEGTEENSQSTPLNTRPLSGAQYISMSNVSNERSYWQPRVDLSGTGDSNPQVSTSSSSWGTWESFLGGVDIHHTSGSSDLMLSYTGGYMYSNESNVPNGNVQELGFSEKVSFRRSVLAFFDELNYLPQASLGFGGVGGLPLTGNSATGLGPGFTSGQSILTGQGQNLENSSVLQLETFLTPRSSISMAGGYSLLHFFGNNLVDSGDVTFQGGYNYQLSRHDTLAILYAFSDFRYNSLDQSIYTHSVEGSYGRRVTGRLAFQVAAGPEFAIFNQGAGTGGGAGTPGISTTHLYWTLSSSLSYQYQRTGLGLNYSHGVSAGSGVIAGSLNDTATGSVTRKMSPTFSSGLSAGYSRNAELVVSGSPVSGQNYDYWFAGASFTHPFTETLGVTFSYQMQYQTSNASFCIGTSCGTSIVRHLVSVGLNWHQRPLLF
jgi:hypothetical protein